ncbi:MAG: hypothetical protein K6T83_10000 [Alicyclobacillus sp.]|nr:hypothetical protein [Alicyclobacillus sp.]
MLYALFQRIPTVWVALFIGSLAAWMYLRVTRVSDDLVINVVKDRISSVVAVYIIFSKFVSGLVLHPSLNVQDDLLSMLGAAPASGWLVGVVAVVPYLLYSFRRTNVFGKRVWTVLAESVFSGGIVFFLYSAVVDLYPFRLEDSLRSTGALILLLWVRRKYPYLESHPQRVWAAFGGMLFVTSILVPHTTVLLVFSPSQWLDLAVIVMSLVMEGITDLRESHSFSQTGNPQSR